MSEHDFSRRQFLAAASAGGVAALATQGLPAFGGTIAQAGKLAALGGKPCRRQQELGPTGRIAMRTW